MGFDQQSQNYLMRHGASASGLTYVPGGNADRPGRAYMQPREWMPPKWVARVLAFCRLRH